MRDAQVIERIVREVIRRLREMETGNHRQSPVAATSSREAENVCTLTIEKHVVTLATLEGRLDGVERLLVPNNAVVTPSVHDELRDRNIALDRHQT